MKKLIFVLLSIFSCYSFAEASRSIFLEDLPKYCEAEIIIKEIPMLINNMGFSEVLDVIDVSTIDKTNRKLVCSVVFVTEKGNTMPTYVTFSKNSVGQVIVSY